MINIPEEVKDYLLMEGVSKNIRIKFPYGERSDITNDVIVQDTVNLTESICSQTDFKFGLCEAATFECEIVDIERIEKYTEIDVYIEYDCNKALQMGMEWVYEYATYNPETGQLIYIIPYGRFVVDSCQKQSERNHRKIIAYTKGVNGFKTENPFTTALYNEIYDPQQSIYTFDVAKFACMNLNVKDFGDIKKGESYVTLSNRDAINDWYLCTWDSKEIVYDRDKTQRAPKYSIRLSCDMVFYRTRTESDAKELYQIETTKIPNRTKEWIDTLFNVLDSEYEYEQGIIGRNINIKEYIQNMTQSGAFMGSYYTESSTSRPRKYISLGEMCNIYPYMGVSYEKDGWSSTTSPYASGIGAVTRLKIQMTQRRYDPFNLIEEYIIPPFIDPETIIRTLADINIKKIFLIDEVLGYNLSVERIKRNPTDINYAINENYFDITEPLQGLLELAGMVAKSNRSNGYEFFTLKDAKKLYPSNDLYPGLNIYPTGPDALVDPSMCMDVWYDDYVKPFGRVSINYERAVEGSSGIKDRISKDEFIGKTEKVYAYLDIVDYFNYDEYREYEITSNYYLDGFVISDDTANAILQRVASKLININYASCDIQIIGQPWIEAGDTVEIESSSGELVQTIVMARTLSGEQFLVDNITAN